MEGKAPNKKAPRKMQIEKLWNKIDSKANSRIGA
jgi:hypothetical protein